MLEFLVLSSPFVWIPLLLIFLAVESALVGKSNYGWATLTLVLTLLALQFLSDVKPFTWVITNPLYFVGVLGAYFIGSVIYAYIKWFSYVHQKIDAIDLKIAEDMHTYQSVLNGTDKIAADKKRGEIMRQAQESVLGSYETLPIQVSKNKARITSWMAFWPVSALFTLFDDPIRRVVDATFRRISGSLQGISNRASAKLDAKYRVGE